jgi:uncharacterized protein (TIGR03435 family)
MRSLTAPRVSIAGATVQQLIRLAYGPPRTRGGPLTQVPMTGGAGWIAEQHFDIEAVPPAGSTLTPAETQQMLRRLLEERFQLKIHTETRKESVYVLTVSPGGARLLPATGPGRGLDVDNGALLARNQPVSAILPVLSNQLGRNVIDQTGLGGAYDFALNWAPDLAVNDTAPSLFTAVQEQLGLRLETGEGPVEVIVIEHVERPSAN